MTNFNWTEITNPKNPVFIIAEAGSNWKSDNYENDLKQAKKLIDAASESGANAIKFQTYRAETVYVSNAGNVDYLKKRQKIISDAPLMYEMSKKNSINIDNYEDLEYVRSLLCK